MSLQINHHSFPSQTNWREIWLALDLSLTHGTEDKKEQPLSYESAIAEILKKQEQNNDTVTEKETDDNDKESEWKQL